MKGRVRGNREEDGALVGMVRAASSEGAAHDDSDAGGRSCGHNNQVVST